MRESPLIHRTTVFGALVLLLFVAAAPVSAATLVAHWAFDESSGTVAHDSVGALDGTLSATGASFVAGGITGNAISLVRANGGLVNMGTSAPGFTTGDFSLVAWVNTTTTAQDTLVIGKHEAGSENGYFLSVNPTGGGGASGKATFFASELVANGVTSATTVNDGQWHQIVGVYHSGGNQSIYVDGTPAEDTNGTAAIVANAAPFFIGGTNSSGAPQARYDGLIDEVALYSGALTDPEIAALYVGSIATPTPTATRTATPTPTATVTATRTPTPVATAPAPTATPTPAGPEAALDDFHCFGIKPAKGAPKFAAVAGVAVTTDVDDTGVVVKGPRQLCLPSDQTLGAIHDAATHLESFQIALAKGAPKPQKHVGTVVTNRLGQLIVDTSKPDVLLVPTAKDLQNPPPTPNPAAHQVSAFACYKAKISKGTAKLAKGLQVTVSDQFDTPRSYDVKKATRLCLAADVNGEPRKQSSVRLLCYQLRLAKTAPKQAKFAKRPGVLVNGVFGPGIVDAVKEQELCIPSSASLP